MNLNMKTANREANVQNRSTRITTHRFGMVESIDLKILSFIEWKQVLLHFGTLSHYFNRLIQLSFDSFVYFSIMGSYSVDVIPQRLETIKVNRGFQTPQPFNLTNEEDSDCSSSTFDIAALYYGEDETPEQDREANTNARASHAFVKYCVRNTTYRRVIDILSQNKSIRLVNHIRYLFVSLMMNVSYFYKEHDQSNNS